MSLDFGFLTKEVRGYIEFLKFDITIKKLNNSNSFELLV